MFKDNKYTKLYFRIITGQEKLKPGEYLEKHHIIPKSLGGLNGDNIVSLSARRHFICHYLLTKMVSTDNEKIKMLHAFMCMNITKSSMKRYLPHSANLYESAKKKISILKRGKPSPNKGIKFSDTARKNIAEARRKSALIPISAETRKKISLANKGKVRTNTTKEKISQALLGKKLSKEHCEKISASNKGKKRSPEEIKRLTEISTGRKHPPRSEEWKSKQRLSHLGKKDSPETTLRKIAAHTGANNPRAKLWTLETDTGQVITISALKTWCREQNISFNRLCNTRKSNEFYSGLKVI